MADTPVYRYKLVSMDGTLIGTFDEKLIAESAEWTLNEQDKGEASFPKTGLAVTDLDVLVTNGDVAELQLWDTANDRLLLWGPFVSASGAGSDGSVHVHIEGVDWYLFRRFLDGDMRTFETNGDFEDDFTGWLDQDGSPPADFYTIVTDRVFRGDKAAHLVGFDDEPFTADKFIFQDLGEIDGGTLGLVVEASAWFFIPTGDFEPGLDGRGLYLEAYASDADGGDFISNDYYVVDSATPRAKWIKAGDEDSRVFIFIPPDTTYRLKLRVYDAALGEIYWDDVKVREFDSIGFVGVTGDENVAADVADLIATCVTNLQNTTFGKSSVNITTDPTDIGRTVFKTYQFFEHVQWDQALEEYVNADNGIDYVIDYTPGEDGSGTRVFKNFAFKRGTDRSSGEGAVLFHYTAGNVSDTNLADYRITKDGANAITRQSVLGEDNGPNREEAELTDASDLGGLVLQDVRQAPQGTEVRSLDGIMRARLTLFKKVPHALEVDIMPAVTDSAAIATGLQGANDLIAVIAPGDLVSVHIADGWYSVDQTMRIHQLRLNCHTNVLTAVLVLDTLEGTEVL